MRKMNQIEITSRISYWKATESPLSSDVCVIRGDAFLWLFDVGDHEDIALKIQALQGKKSIILSHFHKDHIANLTKINYQEIYQSKKTNEITSRLLNTEKEQYLQDPFHEATKYESSSKNHIIEQEMIINDGITLKILELKNSHAKGSLALIVDDTYAFLGDAAYCMNFQGKRAYNAQLLQEEIKQLNALPAKYFLLSHDHQFIHEKDQVIKDLQDILSRREKSTPYIFVPE